MAFFVTRPSHYPVDHRVLHGALSRLEPGAGKLARRVLKVISGDLYTTVCDSLHTILRRGPNRMKPVKTSGTDIFPNADHIDDIRLAASKMSLIDRRAFQAEMAVKYCAGNARRAEDLFGWSRGAVQLGLHEKRTGVVCLSAQSVFGGDKLWEEKHPEVAEALWSLAQLHSQQDPSFRGPLAYTRSLPTMESEHEGR